MVFSSIYFIGFLAALILLLSILPDRIGKASPRKLLLLVASYLFYALWDWRFVALVFASTVVNYVAARGLRKISNATRRKYALWASLALNLGLLGFFKYYNFFAGSANLLLSRWGVEAPILNILLPMGISFYTFQNISYTLDVYWNKQEPVTDFLDFCLLIAFFPKLVAGPLVRTHSFMPQLKNPPRINAPDLWAGFQVFLLGLFKKLMIADAVAPFVAGVFDAPEYYSSPTVWLAVVAYALQIYCDFSGYSDMAIGCARMLGFRLDRNFDTPYLSRDIQDFWRRWHITLSNWLRDYLYIPLGGNRKGTLRTYANLIVTMVLGGLWHGANWTFVIWGSVHGLALALHRWWSARAKNRASKQGTSTPTRPPAAAILGTAATLLFVTLTWVLFRAPNVKTALAVYSKLLLIHPGGAAWYYRAAFAAIGWSVLGHTIGSLLKPGDDGIFETPYSFAAAFTVVLTLLIIFVFAPLEVSPFIYFDF